MSEEESRRLCREMLQEDEIRKALREEVRAWLNEMFAAFGKWSASGLLAAALAGLVYLALIGQGWVHK